MKEQEGPIAGIVPATFYKSCSGCKYHEHTLVKSGNNPIYRDNCKHETAPKKADYPFSGNLMEGFNKEVQPGEWCPFEPINVNPNF